MEITDSARNRMFSNKDLVRLIIPLIIEQMLTVTVGLADSIMTANVGEEAVSGVSLVDSVMVLMINLFSALGNWRSRRCRAVSRTEKKYHGM